MSYALFPVLGCAITVFLNFLVPLAAIYSRLPRRKNRRPVSWGVVALVSMLLSHGGISIGNHRYFSHRSFEIPSCGGKWLLAWLSALTLQGSPVYWAAQHRLHHRHCEQAMDPHSPTHGFWHAHGGFLTGLTGPTVDTHPEFSLRVVADLVADPDLAWFFDRGAFGGAVMLPLSAAVLTPVVVASVGGWHAALWYLHVPQLVAWHSTLSVNSATHTFGYGLPGALPVPCRARNVPWLWGVLLGEAWHANHHVAPHLTSMGSEDRWWEIDPQFQTLRVLERFGFVKGVRQASTQAVSVAPVRSREAEASCALQMLLPCLLLVTCLFTLRYMSSPCTKAKVA